jgi:hypothetical protein
MNMMSHTSDNSIVRDYCKLSLKWTTADNSARKKEFEFDLPLFASSSSQFGKLIKVKLIQSQIRYTFCHNPVSIYIKGLGITNFYGSDTGASDMILLSLSSGIPNADQPQIFSSFDSSKTPEYQIPKIPQKITIVLKDEVNYASDLREEFNPEESNVYQASNLLLEFSYYTDTLNFNDAHTKMMNF